MKTNRTLQIILIIILCFGVYYALQELYFVEILNSLDGVINQKGISYCITYILVGLPLFFGVAWIHNFRQFMVPMGLDGPFIRALLFSLLCTAPMLIGYATVFTFNDQVTLNKIITGAVAAAFFEELYFRGILFGQIYRFTKIGFIPSIIFGALLFAFGHLYQSQDPQTLIGIFLTTFLGAILFAWVYVEWQYNLWVPVFLHLFMNLFWMLFSAGDNAFGGTYANIFRVLTIALIIILTIMYKKRKKIKPEVTRKTLWMRKE
ncbi:CPBP family intramembrane glutamic endopeptidase [Ascidiimonas aurantiaca]|uniref:CPBP family intramembrane glutamic endopeptidase n=1 Tax=Ascidiimonas aurantiaca TaxID=1685432 RepID=UPI0030EDA90B